MNFQEKLLEASAGLRKSLTVLNGARLELRKVAGRHASRFVKQNSGLASEVRKDVSALARTTFASLSAPAAARKPRRAAAARKRPAKAA